MSLKDDLLNEPRRKSGPRCMTCDWYETLPPDARADFDEYISDPRHNRAHLFRVITEKYGYKACDSSLKYHMAHHGPC